jgi:hypothetical protein
MINFQKKYFVRRTKADPPVKCSQSFYQPESLGIPVHDKFVDNMRKTVEDNPFLEPNEPRTHPVGMATSKTGDLKSFAD